MNMKAALDRLKVEKATEKDWDSIFQILEETELAIFLLNTSSENHKNFYVGVDTTSNEIIGCFKIEFEGNIGNFKNFAIKKNLQGKGFGKALLAKAANIAKGLGLKKLYGASVIGTAFWEKIGFRKINLSDSKDLYFLKWIDYLEKKTPQFDNLREYILLMVEEIETL